MNLQIVGLFYDAAGVVTLGLSSIFRMVPQISLQTASYWDFNQELAKAFAYARIDTTTGSILLLVGFSTQIASLVGYEATTIGSYIYLGILGLFSSYIGFT